MQNHDPQNQATRLTLADIYHIPFRHKWIIICLSAAGVLTAALVYLAQPVSYRSEAVLLIRYILESRTPAGIGGEQQTKIVDMGDANTINSEIEIIKSLDLAAEVASRIGPEKILGGSSAQTNKYDAALVLKKSLRVEVPPHTDILRITFGHSSREIVQDVLKNLIDAYLRKHAEIHRSAGAFDDVLAQQTDTLRLELEKTEAALRKAQTNTGAMSIEDSKRACTEQLCRIRQELFTTQVELAERQAEWAERQKLGPEKAGTPSAIPETDLPSDKVAEYKSVCGPLDSYRRIEQELLSTLTEEDSLVKGIGERIAAAEKTQKKLEADYPKMTQLRLGSSKTGGPVAALQAKIRVLGSQLRETTAEAKAINELEPAIAKLQRERDLEEAKYRHFSTSLDQANFNKMLGSEKMSNISVVQTPCPPYRESRRLLGTLTIIVGAGVFCGIALAGLCEFKRRLGLKSVSQKPSPISS